MMIRCVAYDKNKQRWVQSYNHRWPWGKWDIDRMKYIITLKHFGLKILCLNWYKNKHVFNECSNNQIDIIFPHSQKKKFYLLQYLLFASYSEIDR